MLTAPDVTLPFAWRIIVLNVLLIISLPAVVLGISPPIDLGTTIVAIQYKDGVVMGADTRTSVSGSYVSHRYATKLVPVTDSCVIGRSGSSAETQVIAQSLIDYNRDRFLRYDGTSQLSVAQVAAWLRYQMVSGGDSGGSVISLLIAGYNTATNTPEIYSLAPSGALLTESNFAVAGSGSAYIIGHLDDYFRQLQRHHHQQQHQNTENQQQKSSLLLEEGDAIELCHRVVQLAINRDGSSGGVIRLCVINQQGIRQLTVLPPSALSSKNEAAFLPGFADPI